MSIKSFSPKQGGVDSNKVLLTPQGCMSHSYLKSGINYEEIERRHCSSDRAEHEAEMKHRQSYVSEAKGNVVKIIV